MTLLERRRALIAAAMANVSILPSGYTQLEYIQSNGSQYIDTGFTPNQDTRVVVDFQFLNTSASFLFGTRRTVSAGGFTFNISSGGDFVTAYGNTGSIIISEADTNRNVVDKNKNVLELNGSKTTLKANTFDSPQSLAIFACNTPSSGYTNKAKAKIYSFKIYDNDVLERDYIPCTNPSGRAGLYDIINQEFLALKS
jgi:hypothetical protein